MIISLSPSIQKATDEYTKLFDDELSAFISRIENRAKEKIKVRCDALGLQTPSNL